jgi:hypothetical protein
MTVTFNQFKMPGKTHSQKIVEYFESHGWKNRVDDDGYRFWLGGFTSLSDPNRAYIIRYRPCGMKDAGTIKVRIMNVLTKEVYSEWQETTLILGFDDLKRFIENIKDIACHR